jgi:formiminotetrahydrofolate cyclodeaminase
LEEAERLRESLLALVEADAGAFEPVMRAYRLPSGSAAERLERARVLEAALEGACEAPLEIMERCAGALRLLEGFAEKGNSSALSDAGAGACLCRAALVAASLNVYANTRVMADRERAAEFDRRAGDLLARWEPAADELIRSVRAALGQAPSGAFAPANPAP